jgi:hypothetical protein
MTHKINTETTSVKNQSYYDVKSGICSCTYSMRDVIHQRLWLCGNDFWQRKREDQLLFTQQSTNFIKCMYKFWKVENLIQNTIRLLTWNSLNTGNMNTMHNLRITTSGYIKKSRDVPYRTSDSFAWQRLVPNLCHVLHSFGSVILYRQNNFGRLHLDGRRQQSTQNINHVSFYCDDDFII